jgi:hypothetical protein
MKSYKLTIESKVVEIDSSILKLLKLINFSSLYLVKS